MVTEVLDVEPTKVVVYVDQSRNPVSTITLYETETEASNPRSQSQAPSSAPPAFLTPSPSYAPSTSSAPIPSYAAPSSATPQTYAAFPSAAPVATVASSSNNYQVASSSAPASPSPYPSSQGSLVGMAITYSPYQGNGLCKSWDQMKSELNKITGYQTIRLYGTDCDQTAAVLDHIKDNGMQLFAGIYDIAQVQLESSRIIAAVKNITNGDWKSVHTVSVGNELINSKKASVGQVTNAMDTARNSLKQAGYDGHIVTVDTMNAVYDHPEICEASDYCAINCHPFLASMGPVSSKAAGDYVAGWAYNVSTKIPADKQIVISETGWPTQGDTNNRAVASKKDQGIALESLKKSNMSSNMILLTAYNDMWKQDGPGTFNAERFWGIIDAGGY